MTLVVYAAGHSQWAAYLNIPHIAGCGELAVLAAGMIGAVVGFLWFNCHPAQVFMGDTGSLPLGGLLGYMAVVARQELLLVLVGGVFVAEAASVILQVAWYKWRKRRSVPLRTAAPPFSIPRLAGKQDRRPLLDRRGPLCPAGHGMPENHVVEKPAGRNVELLASEGRTVW